MTQPSYVCGLSDEPLLSKTIAQAFLETANRYPDRLALVSCHQSLRWTYRELAEKTDALAKGLHALGLQKGDRLGIWSPNKAEWVLTQLATARLGVILVNINPAYRIAELEYALAKVGCKALVTADRFKTSHYVAMVRQICPEMGQCAPGQLSSQKLPDLEHLFVISDEEISGMMRFQDIAAHGQSISDAQLNEITANLQFDDAINIQFTSGTTGHPKGATLTHHNIINNGYFCGKRQNLTEADSICIPVPLYHCFGMVLGVLTCLTHGAAMVFPDEAFSASSVLNAVSEEKCTALYGVPTMFIAMLDDPTFDQYDLASLRTGIMAGSPCPIEVMKKVIDRMHMRDVTIGYGMTEVSPLSFQTMPDDTLEQRVTTVGQVHPFVEAKIVDDEGCIVDRGTQGEICFRGYSVMRGYWNDAARTTEAIDEARWMHSGDLARMDADGYVNITGRVKDMIIRGGENIYPREIEEFLYQHPDIQDVQVFGVPDDRFGEEVCAWIKSSTPMDASDVRSFCDGQIAHYKVPKHIRFVEEYPMTVTGKVQKFVMRDAMAADLKRSAQKTA
ncbi:MAG: AMP-binding protein [Sphingomonadales bacterium]